MFSRSILRLVPKTNRSFNGCASPRRYSSAGFFPGQGRPLVSPKSTWYPTWYERDIENFRGIDLFSRLLKDRIIFVDGPINDQSAAITVAQLLLLESEDPTAQISMYINSPGGHVNAGMAIYDTMQYIQAPVATLCIGQACSMASLLLAAGKPGLRRALPHSFVMIHQPSSGTQGQASDMEIAAKQILRIKAMLNGLYQKHTGQSIERIERDLDRDTWLSAEEAREWNLIDEVVAKKSTGSLGGVATGGLSPEELTKQEQNKL